MKIKKFRGRTILEALNQVKKEFGEDAVILNSEKVKTAEGDFFEITAAIEETEVPVVSPTLEDKKSKNFSYTLDQELKKDLEEIKELLKKVLHPQLRDITYLKYLEKGVPAFIAKEMVEKNLDLPEYISVKIKEKGVVPHSKYQVFIGEGGVGKTTNIFKIAVWYKYKYEAKVLVLSLDTYKIGGAFQTKRLAELLEIDFDIVDIEDFKEIAQSLNKYDYILVDTPGLNKKFSTHDLEELAQRLPFLRFQWVVKATEHFEFGLRLWEKIEKLPVEGVFLTFTDKIKNSLPILWLLESNLPPLTFISNGERVPEDLLKAEEDVLIKLFLRGFE
ncbi:hypothetical protein [Thermodesulfobacterium sp.]|jgi:flagellar biosynthesis protein FlhF|uniref:flagellar biosynthesis protein FlhF n=1 Tax=Thermodesulfobacterium sp. TaxID=1965289 RepID=UPI002580B90D|nr:hypothetical protein [Thermodesulfobacterium sp.]MBZ4681679.1 hypothetical protein [Thermodesulfobacterium sp.]MDK2861906.1 flagellar biosynthesis protein FlhF [Thermodesulfobacterium sp.]MDN5379651.1 flagellar biosynthesis protein FlhF [Thermodesulfobacterium sp.]